MTISDQYQTDMLQDRFGLKVAARLSDSVADLPPDIGERLRFARAQALSRRKVRKADTADLVVAAGATAVLGGPDERLTWWNRIGAAVPLLALVIGLVAIETVQNDRSAREIARVDAALLMDDLPPSAYADQGFSEFLKINRLQAR